MAVYEKELDYSLDPLDAQVIWTVPGGGYNETTKNLPSARPGMENISSHLSLVIPSDLPNPIFAPSSSSSTAMGFGKEIELEEGFGTPDIASLDCLWNACDQAHSENTFLDGLSSLPHPLKFGDFPAQQAYGQVDTALFDGFLKELEAANTHPEVSNHIGGSLLGQRILCSQAEGVSTLAPSSGGNFGQNPPARRWMCLWKGKP